MPVREKVMLLLNATASFLKQHFRCLVLNILVLKPHIFDYSRKIVIVLQKRNLLKIIGTIKIYFKLCVLK